MRIRRVILGLTRKKKILFLLFAASCVVPFLRKVKDYNYESKLVRDKAFEHLSGKESKENDNIDNEWDWLKEEEQSNKDLGVAGHGTTTSTTDRGGAWLIIIQCGSEPV